MDFVESYPKMSNLLKKLAFTEVYISDSEYQVTLICSYFSVKLNGVQKVEKVVKIGKARGGSNICKTRCFAATTTGNGSRWFSSVYHCKTIDFTICFAVRTQSFAHNVTRRRCRHCSIVQCCTTCVLCEHCQEMEEFFNGCSILHNGRK